VKIIIRNAPFPAKILPSRKKKRLLPQEKNTQSPRNSSCFVLTCGYGDKSLEPTHVIIAIVLFSKIGWSRRLFP
jgi:hypothetical protein